MISVENGLEASRTTAPKQRLAPPRIWCAAELLTKPSRSITARTRSRVAGATTSGRLSTFEAVPNETPACSATSLIVTRPEIARRVAAGPFGGAAGGFPGFSRRSVTFSSGWGWRHLTRAGRSSFAAAPTRKDTFTLRCPASALEDGASAQMHGLAAVFGRARESLERPRLPSRIWPAEKRGGRPANCRGEILELEPVAVGDRNV